MSKPVTDEFVPPEFLGTRFRSESPPDVWPVQFTIVTAWATTGEVWTEVENVAADQRLAAALAASGVWHHRITGYDPGSEHAEPGWAIEQTVEDAVALGLRFKQLGIFAIEGDELWLVMCERPGDRVRVGRFRERLDAP